MYKKKSDTRICYNMSMSDKATKTPLLVKKSDSKKGSLWHDFATRRIIKQHGGFDIPEDDLHAVHKYVSPIHSQQISHDETNAVLSDIEKEIQDLKEKEKPDFMRSTPPKDFEEFLDEDNPPERTDNDSDQF